MGKTGEPVVKLAVSVAEIMFKFTWYVMKLAPIGVFALISFTVGKFGLGMLIPLAKLIGSLYFSFGAVHLLGTLRRFASNSCKLLPLAPRY